jgi:hypothetical protein
MAFRGSGTRPEHRDEEMPMRLATSGNALCLSVALGWVDSLEKWRLASSRGIPVAFRNCKQAADVDSDHGQTGFNGEPSVSSWRRMMEDVMAKVIKFYIPDSLPKKANYKGRGQLGKLIEFPSSKRNQSSSDSAQWVALGLAYIAPFAVNFGNDRAVDSV